MKARKKPVIVDVMQFRMYSTRIYRKCKEFVGDAWVDHDEMPRISPMLDSLPGIKTLEGIMTVSDGDYIIKGVNGEFYPCKPDIFEQTYDAITDDSEKDYGYGFHWNAETLNTSKVEIEKLLAAPIVDIQDTVNVRVSHIYPFLND